MLTLTETKITQRTLSTQEEIAEHVAAEYKRRMAKSPFSPGDLVRITRRDGIPAEFMIGDVGAVVMCDPDQMPLAYLIGVNSGGSTIQFPVPIANLEKID